MNNPLSGTTARKGIVVDLLTRTTAWDRIDKKLDALVEATRATDKPGWPIQVHLWLPPVFGMIFVAAILV